MGGLYINNDAATNHTVIFNVCGQQEVNKTEMALLHPELQTCMGTELNFKAAIIRLGADKCTIIA